MSKTAWIIAGSIVAAGGLATAGYFIWKRNRKTEVEEVFEQETEKKKEQMGVSDSGTTTNPYLGLLIDKMWLMDNTHYLDDPKKRQEYIDKASSVNREITHRGLTFWRTDTEYGFDKTSGGLAVSLPRT